MPEISKIAMWLILMLDFKQLTTQKAKRTVQNRLGEWKQDLEINWSIDEIYQWLQDRLAVYDKGQF